MDFSSEPTPVETANTKVNNAITEAGFTIVSQSLTDGILRFDVDCGGLPRTPDARNPILEPEDSHQKAGERANALSQVIQCMKDCSSIADFEVWLAAEAAFHDPKSSRFGQKPSFDADAGNGRVVLLVQPNIN